MKIKMIALTDGQLPENMGAIGYAGDVNVTQLRITGADPELSYKLDLRHETGVVDVLDLENDEGTLSVIFDSSVLIPSGRYRAQLRTVGSVVWHSNQSWLTIYASINAEDFLDPVPSEMHQIEERVTAAKEAAEDAQSSAETAKSAAETAQSKSEDAQVASEAAQTAAEIAESKADVAQIAAEIAQEKAENAQAEAEAFAIGKRGGVDVPEGDPAYHNNSKYYAEQPVDGSRIGDYSIHGAQKITNYTITKLKLTSQFQSEIDGKYTLPGDGIPGTDIADGAVGFRHWSQASRNALAKEFDQSKAYKKGDYMFRTASGNSVVLMRAKLDIPAGTPYNAANWDNVSTRSSILEDLLARIRALEEAVGV